MSSGPAFVYLETANAKTGEMEYKLISPEKLTRSKLCELSVYASKCLGWKKGTGKQKLILNAEVYDEAAVKKILNAMLYNDIVKPDPLTVNGLKITSFDELINTYPTAQAMDLVFAFKGNDLRDTIIQGIKKKPMSFKRFQQIIEQLDFDTGLMSLVKNHVMYGQVKGGERASPEFVEIRQYCMLHDAQYGLWSEMEAIRVNVIQKMKAEDEKRRKRQGQGQGQGQVVQRSFEEEFPALPGKTQ